jgi:hypothetical protein
MDVVRLLQVPPVVASDKVKDCSTQPITVPAGVIAPAPLVIVTVSTARHELSVYEMIAVPVETPVIIASEDPEELILATAVLLLPQVPLLAASVMVTVPPEHTVGKTGLRAAGPFTVTALVAVQPPESV